MTTQILNQYFLRFLTITFPPPEHRAALFSDAALIHILCLQIEFPFKNDIQEWGITLIVAIILEDEAVSPIAVNTWTLLPPLKYNVNECIHVCIGL